MRRDSAPVRTRGRLAAAVFAVLPALAGAQAQPRPATPAAIPGLSAHVAPLQAIDVFSGVILVVQDSAILHEQAYGLAHAELGVPLRSDHVFRIASVSKPFTRALVGRLVDRGALSLDATIARWAPSIPSADRITVRMLLDHRAGIPNVNSLPYDEEGLVPNTLARLVDSLARRPLDFEPGARRQYSNGGYAVLAWIVERVTGRAFQDVLHDELLVPLALHDTRHADDAVIVPRLVTGYAPSATMPGVLAPAPFQESTTKTGGGSMVSTARDLARWAAAIGRSDVLRPETWRALFPTADSAFAFTGRAPGFNAAVVHDRRAGRTAVVLANNYAAGMVYDVAVAALALARGATPAPTAVGVPRPIAPALLELAPGRYEPPTGWLGLPPGQHLRIRRTGDHLAVLVGDLPVDVLLGQADGRLLARTLWSMLDVVVENGRATAVRFHPLYADGVVTMRRLPD